MRRNHRRVDERSDRTYEVAKRAEPSARRELIARCFELFDWTFAIKAKPALQSCAFEAQIVPIHVCARNAVVPRWSYRREGKQRRRRRRWRSYRERQRDNWRRSHCNTRQNKRWMQDSAAEPHDDEPQHYTSLNQGLYRAFQSSRLVINNSRLKKGSDRCVQ